MNESGFQRGSSSFVNRTLRKRHQAAEHGVVCLIPPHIKEEGEEQRERDKPQTFRQKKPFISKGKVVRGSVS